MTITWTVHVVAWSCILWYDQHHFLVTEVLVLSLKDLAKYKYIIIMSSVNKCIPAPTFSFLYYCLFWDFHVQLARNARGDLITVHRPWGGVSVTGINVLIAVELWCIALMNLKKLFSVSNWMRGFPLSYFTYFQTNSYLHTILNVFWRFLSWRNVGIHEMLLLYLLLSYYFSSLLCWHG